MSDQERMERKRDFRICEPAMVSMVKKGNIDGAEHYALNSEKGQEKLNKAEHETLKGKGK